MSKKYVITTNAGGIAETMQLLSSGEAVYFDSMHAVFQRIVNDTVEMFGTKAFFISDISLKYHRFDPRINCHRFEVLISRFLDQKYDCPQFILWLLEVDVNL